ncbi:MAG: four helix bundle protein [Cytophagaceae bacterium]
MNEELVNKTFTFSLSLIELYIALLRNNEFELSKKVFESGTNIRANVEGSLASLEKKEFMQKIAMASKEAVETRYWLKMIQMKHFISYSCDDCVEQLNEIINTLNYLVQENNQYKIRLSIENLN